LYNELGRKGIDLRQFGEVMELQGEMAKVKVVQHSACASCHHKCGLAHEVKDIYVDAKNSIQAKPGDRVTLELHHAHVLTAALLVYIVPLIVLFGGVLLGSSYLGQDIYGLGLGLAGLIVSYAGIKYGLEPRLQRGKRFELAIIGFSDDLKCEERGRK